MKLLLKGICPVLLSAATLTVQARQLVHIPMEAAGNEIAATNATLWFNGNFEPENMPGAAGQALRFDGYTTFVAGQLDDRALSGQGDMTFSVWVAPQTYPVIAIDKATPQKMAIVTTLDTQNTNGWEFNLGYDGQYGFSYINGTRQVNVNASDKLPCYTWSRLTAVYEASTQTITLYRDATQVASLTNAPQVLNTATDITIGKDAHDTLNGPFLINTFNGLIDDVEILDQAVVPSSLEPENAANLAVEPSRFRDDLWRPRFHGQPDAAWTNETHGLTYYNGKYHLFFQKNANGPYMTRLHWGHLTSTDMLTWKEEKIALMPDNPLFDIKGCWSGCVFTDQALTGGKPNIIYTGVDYIRAYIVKATPADDNLLDWNKGTSPIINGAPSGLGDDFRDPYFFRNGADPYIIVGTSTADKVGAVTLHKALYGGVAWTNYTGDFFFRGTNAAECGTFWEMPNITQFNNGTWLFTTTPQNTSQGVKTIYWTGSINNDGTFNPSHQSPKQVELFTGQGYGLLSPSIMQKDGTTIALGIVPDKLPGADNAAMGWAHLYSFPREWSLNDAGELIQQPYKGLDALRSSLNSFQATQTLNGELEIPQVSGRHVELNGQFTVGSSPFGFNFFKSGADMATLRYNPTDNSLTVDFTMLSRKQNDNDSFRGVYTCTLPEKPATGSQFDLRLYIDGSVLDIFVNNRWATSMRVFPLNPDANGVEAYGENTTALINAWQLDNPTSGIDDITADLAPSQPRRVNVVTLSGVTLKQNVDPDQALIGLRPGIYIVGGKKVLVK